MSSFVSVLFRPVSLLSPPLSDVVLSDPELSREHGELLWRGAFNTPSR